MNVVLLYQQFMIMMKKIFDTKMYLDWSLNQIFLIQFISYSVYQDPRSMTAIRLFLIKLFVLT